MASNRRILARPRRGPRSSASRRTPFKSVGGCQAGWAGAVPGAGGLDWARILRDAGVGKRKMPSFLPPSSDPNEIPDNKDRFELAAPEEKSSTAYGLHVTKKDTGRPLTSSRALSACALDRPLLDLVISSKPLIG